MSDNNVVPVHLLDEKEQGLILCYPRPSATEFAERARELQQIGVQALDFTGPTLIGKNRVLGKGCVGVVVKSWLGASAYALKIRRVDANRSSMEHERDILSSLARLRAVPKLLRSSKNMMLMEYIEGTPLDEFLARSDEDILHKALPKMLEAGFELDQAGVDHGQLSRASHHVIIQRDSTMKIIDFETASFTRKPRSLSSLCHYLFLNPKAPMKLSSSADGHSIRGLLKQYNEHQDSGMFSTLLGSLSSVTFSLRPKV